MDLSPYNSFCKRETFAIEPSFHLARGIPKETWKTVIIPVTATIVFPCVSVFVIWSRLLHRLAVFGTQEQFRASSHREMVIIAVLFNFERQERCVRYRFVDDTIHYDLDLEQHCRGRLIFKKKKNVALCNNYFLALQNFFNFGKAKDFCTTKKFAKFEHRSPDKLLKYSDLFSKKLIF